QFYPSEEAFATDIARVMNLELKALVKAGATMIQIDEPYYSGFPEDLAWGVNVLNVLVEGVDAKIAVHICYGNRYGKPSWEGSYRYLFPRILKAKVQQLTLEFARRGGEDLDLFKEFNAPFELGLGVIDVKNTDIETPDMVAQHIRKALEAMPAERIHILTDCVFSSASRRHVCENEGDGRGNQDRAQGTGQIRWQQSIQSGKPSLAAASVTWSSWSRAP